MLEQILDIALKSNASDIHIQGGAPIMLRIHGDLVNIVKLGFAAQNIDEKQALALVESLMNERQKTIYRQKFEIDFLLQFRQNRLRINAFNTVNGAAAAIRLIAEKIPNIRDLRLPESVRDLTMLRQGLILFTGPTGSGKSTSLAAIINEINNKYPYNIITIEDPIEFVHQSKNSLISQRQVGENTLSFADALRSALREDPDVILVGEMRDQETIRLALTAAETGHLVFATLHTNSAAQTIHRIIDVFSGEDKAAIRVSLADSLSAIISQRLIKSIEGRSAAFEVMIANKSIRNLIREDQIPQINSIMEINKRQGMITIRDSVVDLVQRGLVKQEDAILLMSNTISHS